MDSSGFSEIVHPSSERHACVISLFPSFYICHDETIKRSLTSVEYTRRTPKNVHRKGSGKLYTQRK